MGRKATTDQADERRRGWGEGTIIERPAKDGSVTFLARVWANGKRYTKSHPTRVKAQQWIRAMLTAGEKGTLPKDGGKTTVGAFLDDWLTASRPSLKPTAIAFYDWVIRKHLKPDLGDLKLIALRADHLQTLYAKKIDAGLSPHSAYHFHRTIHAALADAVRWDLVPRNVADVAKAPSFRRKEMTVWTPEEAARFLRATADDRLGVAYAICLYCGLRLGELLGLKWEDVDLTGRRLQVRRTIQRVRGTRDLVIGEPKSAKGRRHIALSAPVVEALRRGKTRQIEERLAAGPLWQDRGFIVTTSVGTPIEPSNFNHYFGRRVKELGLPKIRVHDLRHTCATMLLSRGAHPKVVQEMLGHSQISLTMDTYSHVLPVMQEEAARMLEAVYGAG